VRGYTKKHFSNLIGRGAYGKEEILIMKKGKPMALLLPVKGNNKHLSKARGWLEEGDPFFEIIGSIVKNRNAHTPRLLQKKKTK
jgi:antitoxin (DNA-binding transcriptional repressor) of toxin-antitoxin stability system